MTQLADKVFEDLWVLPHSSVGGKLVLPRWWKVASAMTLSAGMAVNKLVLTNIGTVRFHNETELNQLLNRPADVPLLTVSNHDSCMDDPFMFSALKWKHIFSPSKFRWGIAASNVAYTTKFHAYMFSLGRAMPVVRGAGVYQRSIDFCIDRLNEGCWVHLFPEGKVNMSKELLRLKWGVGRIIAECRRVPLVVPIWHCGFDNVLPNYPPYIPRMRQRSTVLFGSPIPDLAETVDKLKNMRVQAIEMRKTITDRIQNELYTLKSRAEQLHFKEFGIRVPPPTSIHPDVAASRVIHDATIANTEEDINTENDSAKQLIRSVVNNRTIRTLTDANADPGAAGSVVGPPPPPFSV